MSRVERVNCACLAAIVLVLTLLLGSYTQPASSAATAAETAVTVASESEPSGILDLTEGELLRDVWSSYKASVPSEPAPRGQFTIAPEYAASYLGAVPEFDSDYFTIESHNFPGVFHVIHMVASQRA